MRRSRNLREEIERSARELLEQIQAMSKGPGPEYRGHSLHLSLRTMEVEESLRQFLKRVEQLGSQDEQPSFGQRSEV